MATTRHLFCNPTSVQPRLDESMGREATGKHNASEVELRKNSDCNPSSVRSRPAPQLIAYANSPLTSLYIRAAVRRQNMPPGRTSGARSDSGNVQTRE